MLSTDHCRHRNSHWSSPCRYALCCTPRRRIGSLMIKCHKLSHSKNTNAQIKSHSFSQNHLLQWYGILNPPPKNLRYLYFQAHFGDFLVSALEALAQRSFGDRSQKSSQDFVFEYCSTFHSGSVLPCLKFIAFFAMYSICFTCLTERVFWATRYFFVHIFLVAFFHINTVFAGTAQKRLFRTVLTRHVRTQIVGLIGNAFIGVF